jgi:hypothetical protein
MPPLTYWIAIGLIFVGSIIAGGIIGYLIWGQRDYKQCIKKLKDYDLNGRIK